MPNYTNNKLKINGFFYTLLIRFEIGLRDMSNRFPMTPKQEFGLTWHDPDPNLVNYSAPINFLTVDTGKGNYCRGGDTAKESKIETTHSSTSSSKFRSLFAEKS